MGRFTHAILIGGWRPLPPVVRPNPCSAPAAISRGCILGHSPVLPVYGLDAIVPNGRWVVKKSFEPFQSWQDRAAAPVPRAA
jgi:hypothetical protein